MNLTGGGFNTAVGWLSLRGDMTGSFNTAVGAGTLFRNIAEENTAVGTGALLSNSTGIRNTATGAFALFGNTGPADNSNRPSGELGSFNTANGNRALLNNTEGGVNTAVGYRALINNTTGFANSGDRSLMRWANTTTGNSNIGLGGFGGGAVSTANEVIAIGTPGQNVSNSCYIGQIYSNIQPQVGTDPDLVTINSNGRLGRANVSSRVQTRYQPINKASEAIYALKPVSFRYHKQYDQTQTIAFGLIAEEVAEVYPDLVGRNPQGQPESVRYEQINAMLLNEFLKDTKIIEEQQTTIAQLKKEMQTVVARLNAHDSKIQRVSDQLQKNNPEVAWLPAIDKPEFSG